MTQHKPPQEIIDLFGNEISAAMEGRQAFLNWLDGIHLEVGDTIYVPKVGGVFEIYKKENYTMRELN